MPPFPNNLSTDPILAHLASDPVLAPHLNSSHWLESSTTENVYHRLLRAICGQQLSVKAAATIWQRFVELFGGAPPSPAELLHTPAERLRGAGLSGQKSGYVRNIATYFETHPTAAAHWQGLSDEAIIRELTQIKGVGVWTVQMLLLFGLQRPDVFPVGDLGIQQGMQQLYGLTATGKALRQRMSAIAEAWRPYRSYASLALWRVKDGAGAPSSRSPE